MNALPLSKKISEDNIFSQLNLPLSSKWPDIKKAYEGQTKALMAEASVTQDSIQKAQCEQKLKRLEMTYQSFSRQLSEENAKVHQTKEALKSVGLSETADWDKVAKRFDDIRQNNPEQAVGLQPKIDTLQKNKTFLERNSKLGNRTLLTAALVLSTVGMSWAAYAHLSQEEKETVLEAVEQESVADASTESGAVLNETPLLDDAALEQYVLDNTSVEDEMLSLLGILPSPAISLSLHYKMQVFSSLVKSL